MNWSSLISADLPFFLSCGLCRLLYFHDIHTGHKNILHHCDCNIYVSWYSHWTQEYQPLLWIQCLYFFRTKVFLEVLIFKYTSQTFSKANLIEQSQMTTFLPFPIKLKFILRSPSLKCPYKLAGHASGCWLSALGVGVTNNRKKNEILVF